MHWKVGIVAALGLVVAACSSKSSSSPQKPKSVTSSATTPAPAPLERVAARMPVKVGDTAPTGTVVDLDGNEVALASAWAKGPALVVFYRGHW